ncbi:hypothetical protein [Muribaculum sp. NM65_B17]|uniref:hypothetical protein n=1 Tax=Muribaculum sp. NM65_B17 TaxID=2516961 RepID=UPI001B310696|nr:hypothetical protein [Muribaculum sp. NM65_B17]
MVVGVDVHVTTAPPFNPIHPYIGMVMDPADYIPFLGTNVSVNGLKRGVSDVRDSSKIVLTRKAIPLDGHKGGIDEYIIPDWENNGAIEIIRVSGVNPEF